MYTPLLHGITTPFFYTSSFVSLGKQIITSSFVSLGKQIITSSFVSLGKQIITSSFVSLGKQIITSSFVQLYRGGQLLVEETRVPGENHRPIASH
jgi:Na+-transporting NADH:ubiquinone oxidoreductase subunit NqrD